MKKIELSKGLKFVLIILTWLLTYTVTNVFGLISGAGSLIGLLLFYAAILFLDFAYFNDECLQKHAKMSLFVMVAITVVEIVFGLYDIALNHFALDTTTQAYINAVKAGSVINGILLIVENIFIAVSLILVLLKTKKCLLDENCECKKEETKESE